MQRSGAGGVGSGRSFPRDAALCRRPGKNLLVITPTDREWFDSGKIVCRLAAAQGYDVHKNREIHFDVLIALTARRIGAYLITCNAKDVTAIQKYVDFESICW